MGVGGQRHAPAALPPGKTRYPLYRRLGGPQGRSGQVRIILPPQGFDPRTVQPVARSYSDWATAAHPYGLGILKIIYGIVQIRKIHEQLKKKNWRVQCPCI